MKIKTQYKICLLPICMVFVIIPMIVKLKFAPNPFINESWYYKDEAICDFFLYYKSWTMVATGVMMLILLCWQISQMRKKDSLIGKHNLIFIPLLVYTVFVAASSLFSKYLNISLHGMPDQYESVWALLAYVVAVFYTYYVVIYQDAEKSIIRIISIGVGLIGIICVLQFVKIDIYRLIYAGDGYSFTFEPGTVYGPFYNINYVGSYTVLVIPLLIFMTLASRQMKARLLSAVLALLMIISMIGARSTTAFAATAAVVAFAILFMILKNIKEKPILWIALIAYFLTIVVGVIAVYPKINAYLQACDTRKTNLEQIITAENYVQIDYKNQTINIDMIKLDDGTFSFNITDQDRGAIAYTLEYSEEGYQVNYVTDSRFDGMKLTPILFSEEPEIYGFSVCIDEREWRFTNRLPDAEGYYYYTSTGKWTKLEKENRASDTSWLSNVSSLASGRGYIWNRSIDLLKQNIILGSGADTYAMIFPNDDYVDMYNNGYADMFLTKPHNMYLQIALQDGWVALLAVLVFYGWYFISGIRIYFRRKLTEPLTAIGFSIMLGTLGYMITGLANDSTVTVAPVYWALMGIGIGINQKVKSSE